MKLNPYTSRDHFIPKVTRTCAIDSADGFMTLFGEIHASQISKRCTCCGIRQPLANFFKKAVSKLKKTERKHFNKTAPENYREHCITCHEEGLNR